MQPSMWTTGMFSCAAASEPTTVFVSPRKTAAIGCISSSTG